MPRPAQNFKPNTTVYAPKRKTRQTTREAIAIGKSPGLVSPLRNRSNKDAAVSSTNITNSTDYRDSNDTSDDSPPKPPLPAGPTPMDGVSFDTHQSGYKLEDDDDTPPRKSHIPSARQGPNKKRKLVKGKKNKSPSSSENTSSSSEGSDGIIDNISVAGPSTTILGKRKSSPEELFNPAQRQRKGNGRGKEIDIDALVNATVAAFSHDEGTAEGNSTSTATIRKRKGIAINNAAFVTPKAKGITKNKRKGPQDPQALSDETPVVKSQPSSGDKMDLCTPNPSPGKEAAEEIEKLKNQIVQFQLREKQSAQRISEAKRSFEFLSYQVGELTKENEKWKQMKIETANRIRPLVSLLKFATDSVYVDRQEDADYIHWKNLLGN